MEKLFRSIESALADARGDHDGAPRWKVYSSAQIKDIRGKTELNQRQFASAYGLNINSLKSWESGRSTPEQANCLLLAMIDYDPSRTLDLISAIEVVQAVERTQRVPESA